MYNNHFMFHPKSLDKWKKTNHHEPVYVGWRYITLGSEFKQGFGKPRPIYTHGGLLYSHPRDRNFNQRESS